MYKGKMNTLVYGKCPYYKLEARLSITCEGFQGDGNCVIKFDSEEEKNEYIRNNCYLYPNACLICIGCDSKWHGEMIEMKKGDVIHCDNLMELSKTSIVLRENGEKFDVIIDQLEDVYDLLITKDNENEKV